MVCFGRDLEVTYRVWSPKAGYPGDPAYRDFHTYDHPSGLKPSRVTGRRAAGAQTAVRPGVRRRRGAAARRRLRGHRGRRGCVRCRNRAGLVVAAYDTELFGHWWHEGPAWLDAVLRPAPGRGRTARHVGRGAADAGRARHPARGLVGRGKDWHIWTDQVHLTDQGRAVAERLTDLVDRRFATGRAARHPRYDQLFREALLTLSSDWAFLVSHGSSPGLRTAPPTNTPPASSAWPTRWRSRNSAPDAVWTRRRRRRW